MRPAILYPLFASIETLSGVGKNYMRLLSSLCGDKVVDLLWHFPSSLIDRRCNLKLISAESGKIWTGIVRVVEHCPPKNKKQPYRIVVEDETAQLVLVFFKIYNKSLLQNFPIGAKKIISGKTERYYDLLTMNHPDFVINAETPEKLPEIEPVYPLTAGITNKLLGRLLPKALSCVPDFPEWLDESLLKTYNWPDFKNALLSVHHPENYADLEPNCPARQRLAYDELLANQLSLAIVRARMKHQQGRCISGDGHLRRALLENLGFELTKAQQRVIAEIQNDMAAKYRMSRLLQGDVGSGKTIVALFTMLNAVECGFQASIMAPTEILAEQHYESLKQICDKIGVKIELLTGAIKGKKRAQILDNLKKGNIDILVGTHALFTEDVTFKNLAYIVIDEQHRFGVNQRLKLSEKGILCDCLVMTATPIPRTLVLTQFGDMEYSKIDELPKGRKPVTTTVSGLNKLSDVKDAIKRKLETSQTQAYWVCPLIEESEKLDLSAATERFEDLKSTFGNDMVGLIHGKMKEAEKNAVMEQFKEGKIRILVSTTVIEVGVNVANATLMIIEHAERFGLAQLHQLRGRIKRGFEASNCILLYGYPLSAVSRERLNTMRATEDGFEIAEKDLELRGGGEVLGTKQSGFTNFKIADLSVHSELLYTANKNAELILNKDPELKSLQGQNLRTLMYLFERDEAIKTYTAG